RGRALSRSHFRVLASALPARRAGRRPAPTGEIATVPNGSAAIVQKLWNYCNVLRDAGLSYADYIEQLTYLLFLKMADERKQLQPERAPNIPASYEWSDLVELEGDALEVHYRKTLETL